MNEARSIYEKKGYFAALSYLLLHEVGFMQAINIVDNLRNEKIETESINKENVTYELC